MERIPWQRNDFDYNGRAANNTSIPYFQHGSCEKYLATKIVQNREGTGHLLLTMLKSLNQSDQFYQAV